MLILLSLSLKKKEKKKRGGGAIEVCLSLLINCFYFILFFIDGKEKKKKNYKKICSVLFSRTRSNRRSQVRYVSEDKNVDLSSQHVTRVTCILMICYDCRIAFLLLKIGSVSFLSTVQVFVVSISM